MTIITANVAASLARYVAESAGKGLEAINDAMQHGRADVGASQLRYSAETGRWVLRGPCPDVAFWLDLADAQPHPSELGYVLGENPVAV